VWTPAILEVQSEEEIKMTTLSDRNARLKAQIAELRQDLKKARLEEKRLYHDNCVLAALLMAYTVRTSRFIDKIMDAGLDMVKILDPERYEGAKKLLETGTGRKLARRKATQRRGKAAPGGDGSEIPKAEPESSAKDRLRLLW
jgi:hypothetical protein